MSNLIEALKIVDGESVHPAYLSSPEVSASTYAQQLIGAIHEFAKGLNEQNTKLPEKFSATIFVIDPETSKLVKAEVAGGFDKKKIFQFGPVTFSQVAAQPEEISELMSSVRKFGLEINVLFSSSVLKLAQKTN